MQGYECDVLVVGAGPAGSVAALYCSKQGLNTALIERANKIGAHTNTRIDSSTDFGLENRRILFQKRSRFRFIRVCNR